MVLGRMFGNLALVVSFQLVRISASYVIGPPGYNGAGVDLCYEPFRDNSFHSIYFLLRHRT